MDSKKLTPASTQLANFDTRTGNPANDEENPDSLVQLALRRAWAEIYQLERQSRAEEQS